MQVEKIFPASMAATSLQSAYHVRQTLPVYWLPRVKYLPPVRLKEFPKAENELRGVKSGLLGLLTGLHKPELSGMRENTQNG